MIKIHKNDHYAMILIFQKKCGRPGGGGSENSDKGEGIKMGKNLRTSLLLNYALWMAPYYMSKT